MAYGRKISGGKYHKQRKKKKHSLSGVENKVKLRETKSKTVRGMGGKKKSVILSTDYASVTDPKTNTASKAKIKNVLETPANRFLARQNVLIKSAIIETDLGKAKITNRPSQDGMVMAVLVE